MKDNILFVCHSLGDTNACLAVAAKLNETKQQNLHFLVIGDPAKTSLASHSLTLSNAIEVSYLADILSASTQKLDYTQLNKLELSKVKEFLTKKNINKAFIGTPSVINVAVPFQIAECLAEHLEFGAMYNDYLFNEPGHHYWNVLNKPQTWQNSFHWYAPLPKAQQYIASINSKLNSEVVGHPAIDQAIKNRDKKNDNIQHIRDGLEIDAEEDALIFISSGTKVITDDSVILDAMLKVLQDTQYQHCQIRFGIHPSTPNMEDYLRNLVDVLEKCADTSAYQHVKFIITDKISPAIKFDHPSFIRKNILGDQAAAAADAIACAVPATLITEAAINGVPAFTSQEGKTPYLPEDRLLNGKEQPGIFFSQALKKQRNESLNRAELGVPEQDFATYVTKQVNR